MLQHNETGERGFAAAPLQPHSSQQTGELVAALVKARAEMGHAVKNAKNPHFRSDYADLSSVIDAGLPALLAHGLVVTQHENGDTLATYLRHSSGQWLRSDSAIVASKPGAQAHGSALTYARRYALAALLCLAQTDDDGNTAEARRPPLAAVPAPEPEPISRAEAEEGIRMLIIRMVEAETGAAAKKVLADADALNRRAFQHDLAGLWAELDEVTESARARITARRTARASGANHK